MDLRIVVKTEALTANFEGNRNTHGFTLIELVVVIALISILAAVALPRMLDSYENAHEAVVYGAGGAMASAVVLVRAQWISNGSSVAALWPWMKWMALATMMWPPVPMVGPQMLAKVQVPITATLWTALHVAREFGAAYWWRMPLRFQAPFQWIRIIWWIR